MEESILALWLVIITVIGVLLLIFGIRYLKNREQMAMIERGMDPIVDKASSGGGSVALGVGLIVAGAGFGMVMAYFFDYYMDERSPEALYFGMIFGFAGLGLFFAYVLAKRDRHRLEKAQSDHEINEL